MWTTSHATQPTKPRISQPPDLGDPPEPGDGGHRAEIPIAEGVPRAVHAPGDAPQDDPAA